MGYHTITNVLLHIVILHHDIIYYIMSYYMGRCLNIELPNRPKMNPKMASNLVPKSASRGRKMGSRERTQAWPHFTSKIKRFPLVLKEKRQIRGQGRKALANDASNNCVHVNIECDAWCLVRLQNNHETYQCMHVGNPFCYKAVLLTH